MPLPPRWLALVLLLASCDGEKGDPAAPVYDLRIGHVMVEVGHRFETAGRAARVERWGLARYEVHEILEMFEDDMSRALLPGDCNDTVADAAFHTLDRELLPALRDAAEAEDAALFGERFRQVGAQCNSCHAGCNVSFVEVPLEPGLRVPTIEPLEAPARIPAPEAPAPDEPAPEAPAPPTEEMVP